MSLRFKTALIATFVTGSLILIVYALLVRTVESDNARLEQRAVEQDVNRIPAALAVNLATLGDTAGDWAPWDDAYRFVQDHNQEFIDNNMMDSSFATLKLSLMVFVDSAGQVVYAKAFDLENQVAVPIPAGLRTHLQPGDALVHLTSADSQVNGILSLPDGPLLVAARPILTSQYQGPIRGTLILGRFVNATLVRQLAHSTNSSLDIIPIPGSNLSPAQVQARDALGASASVFVQPLSDQKVAGYALLNDIYGRPAAMVQITDDREIYSQGQATLRMLLAGLVSLSLVFGLVTFSLFDRLVVSPLSRLIGQVTRIAEASDPAERVHAAGSGELADLGKAINRMLTALADSQAKMAELERAHQDELKDKIGDLTRLAQIERSRRKQLSALYDLSKNLSASSDPGAILNTVVRDAVKTMQYHHARLALVDGPSLFFQAPYPSPTPAHEPLAGDCELLESLPLCQDLIGRNSTYVAGIHDPTLSPRERQILFFDHAQSVCLIPLQADERILGLLLLGERDGDERDSLSPDRLRLARSFADQAAGALRRAQMHSELENAYLQSVLALANAVDAKDTYTADHSKRLADYGSAVGREMGMAPHELDDLQYAAILHDIGKIGVPDAILLKPTKLSPAEWAVMRGHPTTGAKILAPLPRLAGAAKIVEHHHERFDGKGYPDGLAGDEIPLGARILAVVDAYNAIMDKRIYKEARSQKDAIGELKRCSGDQFDPRVVKAFLRLLDIESNRPREDFS